MCLEVCKKCEKYISAIQRRRNGEGGAFYRIGSPLLHCYPWWSYKVSQPSANSINQIMLHSLKWFNNPSDKKSFIFYCGIYVIYKMENAMLVYYQHQTKDESFCFRCYKVITSVTEIAFRTKKKRLIICCNYLVDPWHWKLSGRSVILVIWSTPVIFICNLFVLWLTT